mmetsp:Transcript_25643/g.52589  ORF Transcript_25643/g.52589 Transcript_25643/m.52589 type:complete len:80 (+) Transcript_25643:130-369(+)
MPSCVTRFQPLCRTSTTTPQATSVSRRRLTTPTMKNELNLKKYKPVRKKSQYNEVKCVQGIGTRGATGWPFLKFEGTEG